MKTENTKNLITLTIATTPAELGPAATEADMRAYNELIRGRIGAEVTEGEWLKILDVCANMVAQEDKEELLRQTRMALLNDPAEVVDGTNDPWPVDLARAMYHKSDARWIAVSRDFHDTMRDSLPPVYAAGCWGCGEEFTHNHLGHPVRLWFKIRSGVCQCRLSTTEDAIAGSVI